MSQPAVPASKAWSRNDARRIIRRHYGQLGRMTEVNILDSGSMSPTFKGLCVANVRWTDQIGNLRPGCLILVNWGSFLAVHRCIRVDTAGGRVLQTADHQPSRSPYGITWLPDHDVLAVVLSVRLATGKQRYSDRGRITQICGRMIACAGHYSWRERTAGRRFRALAAEAIRFLAVHLGAVVTHTEAIRRTMPATSGKVEG